MTCLTGDQPYRKAAGYTGQHKYRKKKRTDIYASNGIRTYDPNVEWAKTCHALECAV
jgi:hypothetical protein